MNDVPQNARVAGAGSKTRNGQRRPARAELIWDGKYDEAGRRVAPLRVALPFQAVETVNESAQDRQRNLLLGPGFREEEWRNRLIWGDKKYVLPSLLSEFAGKVNLIYIDPPFDTGADFSFTATVPDDPDSEGDDSFTFTKEPSIIEHKAYRDTWGRGLDSYLQWFYETAAFLHELLVENGSIYVHLDPGVSHYAKIVLDEIFGQHAFRNEIVWKRSSAHSDSKQGMSQYGRVTDSLLFYTKGLSWTWSQHFQPYKAVKHWSQWIDYWAVDWENKSDTFHNEWQTYRTRKDKSLMLETEHTYADPGEYTVVVKVIDILGNDTTKTVKVKVA